jgi:hypothetical protein
MSVYKKIHLVMKDVQYLKKDDHVKFKEVNYKAISEEKVTSTIRASMVEHGLVIIPIKQEHKKDGNLTTVDVTYKIVDIDTGDFTEAVSSGTGADTQDKGVGKAMTYAYKYLLLRTFAIPTGEDPDKISSTELDEKAKTEVKKQEPDKSKILVVLSKWETLGQTQKAFQDWIMARYQKHIEELTVADIDAIEEMLTKKLMEKKSAS